MPASDLFDDLRGRAWAFALRIAGHPVVYHSGPTPPASALSDSWGEDGPGWSTMRAITAIGSLTERLPQLGGVAEQSPISITLAAGGNRDPRAELPGAVFSRLGTRSATWWGQVVGFVVDGFQTDTLRADVEPPFDVLLDRAPAAIPPPAVIHIGQEAMIATSSDGSEVLGEDPYRLTIGERTVGDTVARNHAARLVVRDLPVVTSPEVVFWRSRRAVLLAYRVAPSGVVGPAVEIMRGFLDQTPRIADDGQTITVELVPLLGLLSQSPPLRPQSARLVRGLHLFERGFSDRLVTGQRLRAWRTGIAEAAIVGDGELVVADADLARWEATFATDAPAGSPRRGALLLPRPGDEVPVGVSGTDDAPSRLILADEDAPYLPLDVLGGLQYIHADVDDADVWEDSVLLDGEAEALLRWPGDADDADDSALGRLLATGLGTVATHTGAAGRWARLDVGAAALTWTSTIWPDGDPNLTTGILVADPQWSAPLGAAALAVPGEPAAFNPRRPTQQWQTVRLFAADEGQRVLDGLTFALAWRAPGERWVLLRDPLDVSSGLIEVTGRSAGVPLARQILPVAPTLREIVVPDIGSDLDGATIYAVELLEPAGGPALAEWTDDDRIDVAALALPFPTSGGLLSYILRSADHLALGGGDLDVASIIGDGADPPWVTQWGFPNAEPGEEVTYEAIVNGILRASRSALAMVTGSDGRSRVTRVPVGAERPARVAVAIGPGAWAAGRVPRWGTEDRIINRLVVRAALGDVSDERDRSEIDWTVTRTFESLTSQRLFEEVAAEEIDLYAARAVDADSPALVGFGAGVLASYEQPRRLWAGSVGTYLGIRAHLGATVQVSSPHLRGYDGQPADEDLAVVTARTLALWDEGVDVEMTHFGRLAAGWNAAMRVATVVDEVTVTVEANRYSNPLTPTPDGSPWRDLTAFAEGETVRCLPRLDVDAGGNRVISAIDPTESKVTFTAAHGLAVGDIITPPAYASASAAHKTHAYLADDAGTLGGAGDEGDRYS